MTQPIATTLLSRASLKDTYSCPRHGPPLLSLLRIQPLAGRRRPLGLQLPHRPQHLPSGPAGPSPHSRCRTRQKRCSSAVPVRIENTRGFSNLCGGTAVPHQAHSKHAECDARRCLPGLCAGGNQQYLMAARKGSVFTTNAAETQGKDSAFATKAAGTQDTGSVGTTKAAGTHGKDSAFGTTKAAGTQGKDSAFGTKSRRTATLRARCPVPHHGQQLCSPAPRHPSPNAAPGAAAVGWSESGRTQTNFLWECADGSKVAGRGCCRPVTDWGGHTSGCSYSYLSLGTKKKTPSLLCLK